MPSASPFDLGKSSKGGGSPFDLGQSSKGSSPFDMEDSKAASPFDQGKGLTPAQERNSLPALEAEAAAVGAPAPAQDSPGAFRRIIDVLMRGNYAAAGAAEELFTPGGGGLGAVPGRVGTEIFSGIGGLEGKKHTFTQVLEEAGVGQLGQFSDLAPFLYNETGQGLPLQKGGWADPTGRGAIGTGLDIALDPTTYVGAGVAGKTAKVGGKFASKEGQRLLIQETAKVAEELKKTGVAEEMFAAGIKHLGEGEQASFIRDLSIAKGKERVAAAIDAGATGLLDKGGIKWMGMHVADSPLSAIARSGVYKETAARLGTTKAGQMALASTSWVTENLVNPVKTLFIKGWGIRGLEGALPIMDDAVNLDGHLKGLMHKDIAQSPLAAWGKYSSEQRDKIFKPVIDAFEAGGMAAVPDEFKPAIDYLQKAKTRMFLDEVASGLLTKNQRIGNYFAHYYRNDPEELARVIYKFKGGLGGIKGEVERLLRLGRNAEERAYPTLKGAIEGSTKMNAIDKSIPVLRPIYDPIESLTRRWDHSITKRVTRQMVEDLQKKFVDLPISDLYDLAKPVDYGTDAAWRSRMVNTLLNAESKDVRTAGTTIERIVNTPELVAARSDLSKVSVEPTREFNRTTRLIHSKLGAVLGEISRSMKITDRSGSKQLSLAAAASHDASRLIGKRFESELKLAQDRVDAVIASVPDLKEIGPGEFAPVSKSAYRSYESSLHDARLRLEKVSADATSEGERAANVSIARAKAALDSSSSITDASRYRIAKAIDQSERELRAASARHAESVNRATQQYGGRVASAETRATREVAVPGKLTKGLNKKMLVEAMSPDVKRAFFYERFKQIGSREEAHAVLRKYAGQEEFFPKQLVQGDIHFAADGSPFKELNVGGGKVAVLPESLANEVAAMSDHVVKSKAGRQLLQGFDTVNNFWKGSVTWMFPSFHFRNLYSNVAQSFVDIAMHAINPKSYVETAHILFGKEPGVFKTALGNYTYDEVRTILNRHGINTSARAIAEFTGNESKILKPFKKFREAGTAIENESRAQLALNYLRRGMDPAEVGARVKKFQLDYSNGLTSFERQWMKRIIPFYSFQRLNLGLQLDNILKRPGMALAQVKPFLGRADENEQMTSWNAGALKLRLNRDGKNVQMITGIDLPIRNLDLLFRGNVRDTMANAVGMLTPLVKTPIEVAANKSLFTGNDFVRANAPMAGRIVEQMPVSMQKWMGYQKTFDKAGRPQYTLDAQRYYLIGQSYATSRILSTADRQWRQYIDNANGTALQSLLDLATGLRFTDMNLDEEAKKKAAERTRDLEQALVRWGTRKEHRNTYVPKAGQK